MRNFIFFLITCIVTFSACSNPLSNEIVIEGNIVGLKSGDTIIAYFYNFEPVRKNMIAVDTAIVKDSKFSIRKTLMQQPYNVLLNHISTDTNLNHHEKSWLGFNIALGDKIQITGTAGELCCANVAGGYYDDPAVKQFEKEVCSIHLLWVSYYDSTLLAEKKGNKLALEKFEVLRDSMSVKDRALRNEFISAHPELLYSALLFYPQARYEPLESVKKQYQSFTPEVQNSYCGILIKSIMESREPLAAGTAKIPAFSVVDVNGKTIKSVSFKGKYVLLDFWGSWCYACRKSNPKLVEIYRKYKDKNFTILGLARDEKDRLLRAVEKDGLTWTQALINQPENEEVAKLFNVSHFPTYLLISPKGIILANSSNFDRDVLPVLEKEIK